MRGNLLLLVLLMCAFPALAISAHRLSLASVLVSAQWVAVVKVLKVAEISGDNGSGLQFTVEVARPLKGTAPCSPADLIYWEGWPLRDGDGKVEAPIWTGSGLERRLVPGDEVLAVSWGSGLSRAEPVSAEAEVVRLLRSQQAD